MWENKSIAVAATLAAVAVGLAGPAWAETPQGSYTMTVTQGGGGLTPGRHIPGI